MSSEVTLHTLRRLQEHIRWLEQKNSELTEQRDALAEELRSRDQFNLYIAQKGNSPTVEMLERYPATKLTGDTTPAEGQGARLI